ncbi:uncharacterized protein LOC126849787 [Cataglyphis hispanica]|uniref:uncharacterized protein LOC126849787 n=1 Tax=Cataglyphis hispanica TaxID=1086592 RepID=UPI00217FD1F9|nr:uncharacterized protein LOC126849787 [Cataglyphis hispanica]
MRSCYICKRKTTLHKFPKRTELRKKWIKACGFKEKADVSNLYICSYHFNLPHNLVIKKKMRLPPGAIPNNNAAINVTTSPEIVNHPTIKLSNVPIIKCTNISKLLEVKSTSSTLKIIDNDNAVQPISEISTSHLCSEEASSFSQKKRSFADVSEITISDVSTLRENFSSLKKRLLAKSRYVSKIIASDVSIPREDFSSLPKEHSFANVSEIITSDISTSRENFSSPKKRPFAYPRYVSEITISDVSTPRRAKKVINFVKKVNENKCKQIKSLQDQNRKLLMRVTTLQDLIFHLKESNLISDDAIDNLMISK